MMVDYTKIKNSLLALSEEEREKLFKEVAEEAKKLERFKLWGEICSKIEEYITKYNVWILTNSGDVAAFWKDNPGIVYIDTFN